jgi:hypothetical protein
VTRTRTRADQQDASHPRSERSGLGRGAAFGLGAAAFGPAAQTVDHGLRGQALIEQREGLHDPEIIIVP